MPTKQAKPKRQTIYVKTTSGPEPRGAWVLGGFAAHKDRYFWTFTHLETGVALVTYPVHENKASALAHLAQLAEHGPPEHQRALLAGFPKL